jgi:hypothetical protein
VHVGDQAQARRPRADVLVRHRGCGLSYPHPFVARLRPESLPSLRSERFARSGVGEHPVPKIGQCTRTRVVPHAVDQDDGSEEHPVGEVRVDLFKGIVSETGVDGEKSTMARRPRSVLDVLRADNDATRVWLANCEGLHIDRRGSESHRSPATRDSVAPTHLRLEWRRHGIYRHHASKRVTSSLATVARDLAR